jgi:hypothetical protein
LIKEYKTKHSNPKQLRIIKNPANIGKIITTPIIIKPKARRHEQLIIV